MPRKKKDTMNNKKPYTSKNTASKQPKRPVFKFDMNEIVKRRQLEGKLLEQTAKQEEEMKVIDKLYQEQLNQTIDFESNEKLPLVSTHFDPDDFSNYNIPFKENSDSDFKKLCVQRLHIMSIEGNELQANIHFNHLLRANWSPGFDNVQNILCKWRADLDTVPSGPPLEYQIKDYKNIRRHNFELVINFISYCILKNNKKYSVEELLTIAKYTVMIYFHMCGQLMINVLQSLFTACINTALKEDNDHAIIAFAQELYSEHNEDDLLNMIVDLFLPLEGPIMKKMYTYITYKLFKSLLGKTDNEDTFPSSIKEWFVQDVVDKNYFKKTPKKVLSSVVQLLEHVVFVFDLYKEEKKLEDMYNFLHAAVKPSGLSDSMRLVNVLDQWRLQLFRLYVNRKSDCTLENNDITNK
ncbi:uncharacterized protein LOC111039145 [Myzus persicae]|uniref:uncharacterized protein LOC111039145 n=1 Tax=Myzus persicae TaxID=13164 RepID=UPI000B939221|nr:uncharacterized protein LOC111039145 [Myzus persicae]XP_022178169.1 uncharacterized protein LOC111039145 [Myzus persicae]XP_022178170.1 uncharacterized protein LOC111039145 [Myzus persicae]